MATVVQPDGKIIVGGVFATMGGVARTNLARINADGSNDSSFTPGTGPSSDVNCVALLPDGKILIGGFFNSVNSTSRTGIARLNANGTVDTAFNPGSGASGVNCIAVQPDGKILIAGGFTTVNGSTRNRIARLNADGSLEATTFGTGADNQILGMALQTDGKILIGGYFSNFNSTSHPSGLRLNADGTVDSGFTVGLGGGQVYCIAVQGDGKIWFGGDFTTVNSVGISRMVRLNPNGTTATAITGSLTLVRTMSLQTDGKLLVGGDFTALNGVPHNRIARLNADGSLESAATFNAGSTLGADNLVRTIVPQPDGKILVGGNFATMNGTTRNLIARLQNDSAAQSLLVPSALLAQWSRSGAGPEVLSATFELSTDGGTNWTSLGNGTRTASGWDMSGLSLSGSGLIRARGRVYGGHQTGSSTFTESVQSFNTSEPEIAVEQPVNTNLVDNTSTVSFGTGMTASTSAAKIFTIRNVGLLNLTGLAVTKNGTASSEYTIDTTGMSSTVAPGATTTFSVTFTPSVIGTRTAALHIASNDSDENPFDIALTGAGVVASQVAQQAYAKASNPGAGDVFGVAVAISGDTVVVGALLEDSNTTGINSSPNESAADSGAVYVFVRSGSTWTQQAYIKASNTGAGDQFGQSVALAGDTLVVGAFLEDSSTTGINSSPNESAADSGAAYVFVRSGVTWTQQAYLKASNTGAGDRFGNSVSISGDSIIVGAYFEDSNATTINGNGADNSLTDAGSAYIFTRSGTTWTQQAYLKPTTTGFQDQFGISVGISGDTVVVGDYGDDSNAIGINGSQSDNSAADSGAAYVFVRSGTTWTQQAFLKASNTRAGDLFGFFSAIDGNTIVISSIREDSAATGINGSQSDNTATDAGAAYVYTRSGVTWTQQAYLKPSNTGAGDNFGRSVAISGDTILIGSNFEDSLATGVFGNEADNNAMDSGAAYVFIRAGSTWVQQAYLKASNTDADDRFGYFVGLSGSTAVVGATNEDSNATGVGGTQSNNSVSNAGAVYIYTGLGPSDIAVDQPVGTALADGVDSIGFGSVAPGSGGTQKIFTLTNTGVGPVSYFSVIKDGTNASEFNIDTTGMSTSLAAGASTTFTVTFTPTAAGARSAALHIYCNDIDESPFDVALTGTGVVVPEIVVEQPVGTNLVDGTANIDFGNVASSTSSAAKTFTISNIGNASLSVSGVTISGANAGEFSISSFTPGSVLPAGTKTFNVTFSPSAIGARTAALQIANDDADENPFDIALTGTGVVPSADLSALSLSNGALSPVFASGTNTYSTHVNNTITSVTITPTAADSLATITVGGTAVASGTASAPLNLVVGLNQINVVVTSQGGSTVKTYTLNIIRDPVGVVRVDFDNLTPGVQPANFLAAYGVPSVTFSGAPLGGGPQVVSTVLDVGNNSIPPSPPNILIQYASGSEQGQAHILTFNFLPRLSSFSLDRVGKFGGGSTDTWHADFYNAAGTLIGTFGEGSPVGNAPVTTFTFNAPGAETIARMDLVSVWTGVATNATIPVDNFVLTRSPTLMNANLSGLAMSPVGFAPLFNPLVMGYASLVSHTTGTVTITATMGVANATMTINGNAVANGVPINVNVVTGSNAIPIVVTTGDAVTTQTYTLNVTRPTAPGASGEGGVDNTFNTNAPGGGVGATTLQPDGKVIVVGLFSTLGGQSRNNIARLNADGSVESTATFTTGTGPNGQVYSATVQTDGKIIVTGSFTNWNGSARNRIARLNSDGSLENLTTFAIGSGLNSVGYGTWVQPDGKILVWGLFSTVNGQARNGLARLNPDGGVESTGTFDIGTGANNEIIGAALQSDGKILVGGLFTQFNGQTRPHVARLNSDGSVESLATFNPGAGVNGAAPYGSRLFSIVPQPDGRILLGGEFITVDGQSRNGIARINADGSLESSATFNPGAGAEGGEVRSMALQTDGRIILGGFFHSVGGQLRNGVARLQSNGAVESTATFNTGAGAIGTASLVLSTALQSDGRVLLGGDFSEVNGASHYALARLLNGAATQSLTVTSSARVQWLRGGTSPEVTQVTFEKSTDGNTWTMLGAGARIGGGWEITGLSLPPHGYTVRARGRVSSCDLNGSCGLVESTTLVPTLVTDFRQLYFATTSNTGIAADTADPDNDGLENIVEYAFGLNPVQPGASSQLPQPVHNGGNFGFSFVQPPNVTGVIYGAKCSVNMVDWVPVPDTGSGGAHVFSVPFDANRRMFLFLVVTPQP